MQDEVPEQIQQFLDIAYNEWSTLAGKTLKKVNKYTEWRGKGVSFEWCGGFVTWCMMEAGIDMLTLDNVEKETEVSGIAHVKEASVGKIMRGYLERRRTTNIPQRGFLIVYGENSYNRTVHIGIVYDVQKLDNGKYRITTIEGNMSNRVKMYVKDYDPSVGSQTGNLSAVPVEERTQEETSYFNYKISSSCKTWYANVFLMPWIPGDTSDTAQPEVSVTPAPEG